MSNILFLITIALIVILAINIVVKSIKIVSQSNAFIVERLGKYNATLDPGVHVIIPFIDKVRAKLDLRERIVTFPPQPVITKDNVVVSVDSVIYFQIIDPKSAVYEIANYIRGIEQITITTLRNIIGGIDLEAVLTSREKINSELRLVLDETTGKWGVRANRIEIKTIDPPKSIQEAMEKQMRAERDRRASILSAEGVKQSLILNAQGERESLVLRANGEAESRRIRSEAEAQAIKNVFTAIKNQNIDSRALLYQYINMLPELAKGDSNKTWIISGEFGKIIAALESGLNTFKDDNNITERSK